MIDSKKQWFFLGLISLWILASVVGPVVAFCLTGNPLSFSLVSTLVPPLYVLSRIVKSLFPLNDGDVQIALARAQRAEKRKPANLLRKADVHLLPSVIDKISDTKT